MEFRAGPPWSDIYASIGTLGELLDCCLAALDDGKGERVISSTTKKKLSARAVQGLRNGKQLVQELTSQLHQAQAAADDWEQNVLQASHSHKELLTQLEGTSKELQVALNKLREAELARLAANQEVALLRQQLQTAESTNKALQATIDKRDQEFAAAGHGRYEAEALASQLEGEAAELRALAAAAQEQVAAAEAGRAAAQELLAKETSTRERHEDAVARLTADNLEFMAKLQEAEGELTQLRTMAQELKEAVQEQKGPWFEEVKRGVESRVKEALSRAESLEAELATQQAASKARQEALQAEKAALEEQLGKVLSRQQQLARALQAAQSAEIHAKDGMERGQLLAAQQATKAAKHAADARAMQETLRNMREECHQRWSSQQEALGKVSGLEETVGQLRHEVEQLHEQLQERKDELVTQRAVNQQLMLKKEEVEWQLMAAMAKMEAAGLGNREFLPPGLGLQLLGSLQLDRPQDPSVPTTGPLYGGLSASGRGSGGGVAAAGTALGLACNSPFVSPGGPRLPGSGWVGQQQWVGVAGDGDCQVATAVAGRMEHVAGGAAGTEEQQLRQQHHMLDGALALLTTGPAGGIERGESGSSSHSQDVVNTPDTVKGSRTSDGSSQAAAVAGDGMGELVGLAADGGAVGEGKGEGAGAKGAAVGSGGYQRVSSGGGATQAAAGTPVLRRSPSSSYNVLSKSAFAAAQLESAFAAPILQQLQQPPAGLGIMSPAPATALSGRARGGSVSYSGAVPATVAGATPKLCTDLRSTLHMLPGLQNASSLPVGGSGGLTSGSTLQNPRLCSFTDLFSLPTLSCSLATIPAEAIMPGVVTSSGGGPFSPTSVMTPTGGLMAPFSPLPRAASMGLKSMGSIGAVFPECATASAVTDIDLSVDLGRELGQLGLSYSALMAPPAAAEAFGSVLVTHSGSGASKGSGSSSSSGGSNAGRTGLSPGLLSREVGRAGSGGGGGGAGDGAAGEEMAGVAAGTTAGAGGVGSGHGLQHVSEVAPAAGANNGLEHGEGATAKVPPYAVVHPVLGTPVYTPGSSRSGSYSNLLAANLTSSCLSNSSGATGRQTGHGQAQQAAAATAVTEARQTRMIGTSPLPSPNSKGILRHDRAHSPSLKSVRFSFDDGLNEAALSDVPLSSPSSPEGGGRGGHGIKGGSGAGLSIGVAGNKQPWEQHSYHDADVPSPPGIKAVYGAENVEAGGVYGSNSSCSSGDRSSLHGDGVRGGAAGMALQQRRQRVNGCWYSGGDADSYQSLHTGSPMDGGLGPNRGVGGRAGGRPPAKPLVPWGKGVHPVLGALSLPKPRDGEQHATRSTTPHSFSGQGAGMGR